MPTINIDIDVDRQGKAQAKIRGVTGQVDQLGKESRRSFEGLRESAERARGGIARLETSFITARRALGGLVALFAAGATARFVSNTIDATAQVDQLALRLGTTTEFLSEMGAVAERNGVSIQTFGTGVQRMTRRIAEAAAGTGEAKGALEELGLAAEELNVLSLEQQFFRFAEAIGKVEGPADRVRLAMRLLDTEGVSFLQFLNDSQEPLRQQIARVRELGATLSPDLVTKNREAQRALGDLSLAFSSAGRELASSFLPEIRGGSQLLTNFARGLRGVGAAFRDMLEEFRSGPSVNSMIKGVANEIRVLEGEIDLIGGRPELREQTEEARRELRGLIDDLDELEDVRRRTFRDVPSKTDDNLEDRKRREIELARLREQFDREQATRNERLADVRQRIAEGRRRTLEEEAEAERDRARRLGDIRERIARGRRATQRELAEEGEQLIGGVRGILEAAIGGVTELAGVGSFQLSGLLNQVLRSFPQIESALKGVFERVFGSGGTVATSTPATGATTGASITPVGGIIGAVIAAVIAAIPNFIKSFDANSGIGQRGGVALDLIGLGGLFQSFSNSIGGQPQNKFQSIIQNQVSSFIDPFQGIIVQALINAIAGVPDPRVRVNTQVGLGVSPLTGRIDFDRILLDKVKREDIDKREADRIANQVIAVLENTANSFTRILDIFPEFVVREIIPAVEESNRVLGELFGRVGFSERGPLTIADELRRFSKRQAQEGFFLGTRGLLGEAAATSFTSAGLSPDLAALARELLPGVAADVNLNVRQTRFRRLLRQGGGLQTPRRNRDIPAFIEALQTFSGISGGLANAAPFLTGTDTTFLEQQLTGVLGITRGEQFTTAVGRLGERVNPILTFIEAASEQARSILGRGLTAAIEAANESQAKTAFLQSFGEGIRGTVLAGLQQAFIASAQFDTLLAPIQQTIREFVQQSLLTGEPPDLAAFRTAILPTVEEASATALALSELAPAFNEFRKILEDALRLGGLGGSPAQVFVNIENISSDIDVDDLMQQIGNAVHQGTTV